MVLERALLSKFFVAISAHIWFFTSVNSFMIFKGNTISKPDFLLQGDPPQGENYQMALTDRNMNMQLNLNLALKR